MSHGKEQEEGTWTKLSAIDEDESFASMCLSLSISAWIFVLHFYSLELDVLDGLILMDLGPCHCWLSESASRGDLEQALSNRNCIRNNSFLSI